MSTSARKMKLLQTLFWSKWQMYIQAALSLDWQNTFSIKLRLSLQRSIRMAFHYEQTVMHPEIQATGHTPYVAEL